MSEGLDAQRMQHEPGEAPRDEAEGTSVPRHEPGDGEAGDGVADDGGGEAGGRGTDAGGGQEGAAGDAGTDRDDLDGDGGDGVAQIAARHDDHEFHEVHEDHEDHDDSANDGVDEPRRAAQLPVTGDRAVDEALAALPAIAEADPAEQLEVYIGVHRSLHERLADSGA